MRRVTAALGKGILLTWQARTMDRPMPHADVERGVSTVRAFRGMKRLVIILAIFTTSCSTTKRAIPCRQCPQYSYTEAEILEYIKLNPYPHELAYE